LTWSFFKAGDKSNTAVTWIDLGEFSSSRVRWLVATLKKFFEEKGKRRNDRHCG
jgi:hypothetical protein